MSISKKELVIDISNSLNTDLLKRGLDKNSLLYKCFRKFVNNCILHNTIFLDEADIKQCGLKLETNKSDSTLNITQKLSVMNEFVEIHTTTLIDGDIDCISITETNGHEIYYKN
jgi:hypothetical protein